MNEIPYARCKSEDGLLLVRRYERRLSCLEPKFTSDSRQPGFARSGPAGQPSPAFVSEGWWPGPESNQRHRDFQSRALPTELPGLSNACIDERTNLHYNMPYMLH